MPVVELNSTSYGIKEERLNHLAIVRQKTSSFAPTYKTRIPYRKKSQCNGDSQMLLH